MVQLGLFEGEGAASLDLQVGQFLFDSNAGDESFSLETCELCPREERTDERRK